MSAIGRREFIAGAAAATGTAALGAASRADGAESHRIRLQPGDRAAAALRSPERIDKKPRPGGCSSVPPAPGARPYSRPMKRQKLRPIRSRQSRSISASDTFQPVSSTAA